MPFRFAAAALAAALLCLPLGAAGDELLVYFGTYTSEQSKGIYVSRLDLATGTLTEPRLAAEAANPSFLAAHHRRPFLYAVNEVATFEGKAGGAVSAFAVDTRDGGLRLLNRQSSGGAGPAHLTVDRQSRHVLVANYGGGSTAVLPIDREGRLQPASAFVQHTGSSVNPERQKGPHAHAVAVDPSNRFAYVADLGLDRILIHRYDGTRGTLTPAEPAFAAVAPGSGPRHLAIHGDGRFAFVINELLCTITVFSRDPGTGALTERKTVSTLPEGVGVERGYSTAEILVHPSGRFVYGSNRGHDSLAVFAFNPRSGDLTLVEHEPTQGRTPRGFGIDPTGAYLIAGNQRSDTVVVFRIDKASGRLAPTGQRMTIDAPVSVEFVRP